MLDRLPKYLISIIEQQNLNFKISIFEDKKIQTFLGVVQKNGSHFQRFLNDNTFNHMEYLSYLTVYLVSFLSVLGLVFYAGWCLLNSLDLKLLVERLFKITQILWHSYLYLLIGQFLRMLLISKVNWGVGLSFFNENYCVSLYTHSLKIIIVLFLVLLFNLIHSWLLYNRQFFVFAVEFILLLHVWLCSTFVLISANHFGLFLISLEVFSLILYILTTTERTHGGIIASAKYFVFGTLGSIFLFWGLAQIYSSIPSLNYKCIFFTLDYTYVNIDQVDPLYLDISSAFVFIITGLLIKIWAAPFHNWVPDVYCGAPMPVTAFFATLVKFILFIFFVKFSVYFNLVLILNVSSLCSLIIGTYLTLKQL